MEGQEPAGIRPYPVKGGVAEGDLTGEPPSKFQLCPRQIQIKTMMIMWRK